MSVPYDLDTPDTLSASDAAVEDAITAYFDGLLRLIETPLEAKLAAEVGVAAILAHRVSLDSVAYSITPEEIG